MTFWTCRFERWEDPLSRREVATSLGPKFDARMSGGISPQVTRPQAEAPP